MATIEVVSPAPAALGEGPHWDPIEQALIYVDIIGGSACRLNPNLKELHTINVGDHVSFAIPRAVNNDEWVIGRKQDIEILNWKTGNRRQIVCVDQDDQKDKTRLNDGKCDALGRLWTGTMFLVSEFDLFQMNTSAFYSLDRDHQLKKHISNVSLSNGISWTLDNQTMFYIDSLPGTLDAFDFDLERGELSRRRTIVNFPELWKANYATRNTALPDGMTTDNDGKLWIACYDGGRVIRVDPETGKVLQSLEFPVTKVTSCCFGGPNYNDLYVTSVYHDLSETELKAQPLAGHVFKVTGLGVKGSQAYSFSG